MVEREVCIRNETGLHARPASQFVGYAKTFESEIHLIKDEKAYNAKSILSVLAMGANKGTVVRIRATGTDEARATDALVDLVEGFTE